MRSHPMVQVSNMTSRGGLKQVPLQVDVQQGVTVFQWRIKSHHTPLIAWSSKILRTVMSPVGGRAMPAHFHTFSSPSPSHESA